MKKWTSRAVIETTLFQLSDEEKELARLELAEIKEATGTGKPTLSCRFNAIYAGTTKNLHTYPADELNATVGKWIKPYPKPVLVNHDMLSEPLGRISEDVFLKESDTKGVLQLKARISDPAAIEKILDGRYLTVSIGSKPGIVECSICGANWFEDECDHTMGEVYVDQIGEQHLCTAVMRDINPSELSFVNLPADTDDSHFAGIVTIGESEDFEFYSEAEGVGRKSLKRPRVEAEDALAFKEAFEDLLSLLKPTRDETHNMEEQDKTKPVEEEITVDEGLAGDTSDTSVAEEEVSQEENVGEGTEAPVEDTETPSVEETDAEVLESILAKETEPVAQEEVPETPSEEPDTTVQELENRIQQLEADKKELQDSLTKQEESAVKWFEAVRVLLGEHLADLKVVLGKATSEELEELQAAEAQKTLKSQISELRELREEFKQADSSITSSFSQNGILESETLAPEQPTPKVEVTITESVEKPKPFVPLMDSVIKAFSNGLSNKTRQG